MARQASSSHRGPSLQRAVSTTRRCMVPSCSIRVATTLISSFCARPVQQTTGRPGQGPAKTPVAPPCPGCSFLPFPACPGMRQPSGPSRGRGASGASRRPYRYPRPRMICVSPVQACRSLPFSSPDKIIVPVITIAVGDRRSFVAGEQPGPWGGRRPGEPRQHVHASRKGAPDPPLGADICLSAGQMLTAQTRIFCTSAALCRVQAGRQTRTCGCRRSSDEGRCLRAVRTA